MGANPQRANTGQKLQQVQQQRQLEEEALKGLFAQAAEKRHPKRQGWLKTLGWGAPHTLTKNTRRSIAQSHDDWAEWFNKNESWQATSGAEDVLEELLSRDPSTTQPKYALRHLLIAGDKAHTVLHTILDPSTYVDEDEDEDREVNIDFHLDRLKPLIRFLLLICPDLPAADSGSGPPIVMALRTRPRFPSETKAEIVRFLCKKPVARADCLGSPAAVRSLAVMFTSVDDDNKPIKTPRPVIHEIIESADFTIDEDVLREVSKVKLDVSTPGSTNKKESKPCLEVVDERGRTCLHWVLTIPLNATKIWWARKIAEFQPRLLMTPCEMEISGRTERVTPLQYMSAQKALQRAQTKSARSESKDSASQESELRKLENFLKLLCIREFDNSICKNIMYTRDNARELFLTLEDDVISWESLNALNSHYKLDTMLRSVHICNNVTVRWTDAASRIESEAKTWTGAGKYDLYMAFHWLKMERGTEKIGVKKVIEVMVDDGAKPEARAYSQDVSEQFAHSDKVIVQCLKGLDVESLDWRRADIPAERIVEAAGDSVKNLRLYCSGLQAVLQSWADQNGLARLKELEKVHVEINQGLESLETINDYGVKFKADLESASKLARESSPDERIRKKPPLSVKWKAVRRRKQAVLDSSASKLKDVNEQGFAEQDWLKCMDEFCDIVEMLGPGTPKPGSRPIRVALIDDGVKTSFASLDNNIGAGMAGWPPVELNADGTTEKETSRSPRSEYYRNYNSSTTGHGTVMAYYLRRICPSVKFYVAKLEPEPQRHEIDGERERVTFSIESAAQAIEWAVDNEVDIISMSWAINKENVTKSAQESMLRTAIRKAVANDILLFCANPDKGADIDRNNTYPWLLQEPDTKEPIFMFCIGAATQEKVRWAKISPKDDSCHYFLPGVDLGIQVESTSRKNTDDPPKEWHKYSGSSLSCALAAGLAAMILHCALLTGEVAINDAKWKWLRTAQGMRNAFARIQLEGTTNSLAPANNTSKWLPVRNLFGNVAKKFVKTRPESQPALIGKELVQALLFGMPEPPAPVLNGEAEELPLAPLSRRGTRMLQGTDEGEW